VDDLATAVARQVDAQEEHDPDLPREAPGDHAGTSPAEEYSAPPAALQFNVVVSHGRYAVVILPAGMTPLEALRLVKAIPDLAAKASAVPTDPEAAKRAEIRSRLVL
jgi:hypothetical protein